MELGAKPVVSPTYMSFGWPGDICYKSQQLTALKNVWYPNVIWNFSKFEIMARTVAGTPSNVGLILEHITILNEVRALAINHKFPESSILIEKTHRFGYKCA